jgi:hypothetical protein
MYTHTLARRGPLAALSLVLLVPALGAQPAAAPADGPAPVRIGPHQLSGPYRYENLTLFLIHGPDQLKGKTPLTLQEAMRQKKVIVHETQNVNQLAIENVSADTEVFVQSGDIVKGGQQDRTIALDLILPPKSGKLPVASFCVEHGRWTRRGAESVARFDSSAAALPSKEAKRAVKEAVAGQGAGRSAVGGYVGRAQQAVWMEVAKKQKMLAGNLGGSVKSAQSQSSLQLTLEDKKLLQAVDRFEKKLAGLPEGKKDVIGFAYAVNGEVYGVDIFPAHGLFVKLWPKLLNAAAVEAIAEAKKGKKFEHASAEAVKAFMLAAEKGKASRAEVDKRVRLVTHDGKKNVLFVTEDQRHKGLVLRRSYIAK